MYQGKGNTAAAPRRRKAAPSPERQAQFIADSIRARQSEGRGYRVEEYGIADNADMIERVARALNIIR